MADVSFIRSIHIKCKWANRKAEIVKLNTIKDSFVLLFYLKRYRYTHICIYLKGRVNTERGTETKRKSNFSIHWFNHQIATSSGDSQVKARNQKFLPVLQPRTFPGNYQGGALQMEQQESAFTCRYVECWSCSWRVKHVLYRKMNLLSLITK